MLNKRNDIQISLLETLTVFAKEKTTAKTARKLGVTQPTISRQLIQLEKCLPHKIFTMRGRNKILTNHGEILAKDLSQHFEQLLCSLEKANEFSAQKKEPCLKIGATAEILQFLSSKIVVDGDLELRALDEEGLVSQMQMQKLDVLITQGLCRNPKYVSNIFFESTQKVAIPKKWLKLRPNTAQWARMAHEYPFGQDDHAFTQRWLQEMSQQAGHKLLSSRARLQSSNPYVLKEQVLLGNIWAILPDYLLDEKKANYYVLSLPKEVPSQTFYIHYRTDLKKNLSSSKLLTALLAWG